jgi:hypothetical protein
MGNTRALKAKILRQIRALQQDLQAIERVEEIERRQSASGAEGEEPGNGDRGRTLIGTVEQGLKDEWQAVSFYLNLAQTEWPNASRAAVSTALQRLADRGIAEVQGNRQSGYEYKRKAM